MRWRRSYRADPRVRPLADRHYNRQSVGSLQFAPPGRCLVLATDDRRAFWITSWPIAAYVHHAWAGAWVCSAFRNEGAGLASDLIREAVAATRAEWPEAPALGLITFVNATRVKSTNPGCCFKRAGFRRVGETEGGLLAFQMLPAAMPPAEPAMPALPRPTRHYSLVSEAPRE